MTLNFKKIMRCSHFFKTNCVREGSLKNTALYPQKRDKGKGDPPPSPLQKKLFRI